jgi:Mn2+/Fe2+ NRAMP family transporter
VLLPTLPAGGGGNVLSLVGGIGGTITMLSYNYWMREENLGSPDDLRYVRGDVAIAYVFTAVFGMSIMVIANQAFFIPGLPITDAEAISKMAEVLGTLLGPFGVHAYEIGFYAAVFAALLGVWQSVPYFYADIYGVLTRVSAEHRRAMTKVTSTHYRLALLFVMAAPLPFAFTGRPLGVIVVYTIVASLFVPFLAATLLYLNNRVPWRSAVPHNHWSTNIVLVAILALFAAIGLREVIGAMR